MMDEMGAVKKKRMKWLTVTLAAAVALTACKSQVKEPVVAERTNPAPENTVQGEKSPEPANEQKLAARLEVPERYEVSVEGDRVLLTADADVWVPDRETMPECRMKQEIYSEADYRAFQQLTAQETGVQWGEDKKESATLCLSLDGTYQISFVDGKTEGTTPILWMKHQYISDGSSKDFDSRDISGLTLTEEEKSRIEAEIQKRAEFCLEKFDEGSFALKTCQWRALQEQEGTYGGTEPTGTYGIKLHYVKEYQGIPVAGTLQALMGLPAPSSQYVNFLFDSEGTLLKMQAIDRVAREGEEKDSQFLLLFDTAAQIFEQYCKTYFKDEEHWTSVPAVIDAERGFTLPSGTEEKTAVEVRVNSVMLEYRLQPEEGKEAKTFSRGDLIPVWNFYGTVAGSRESLLVSINAEDGTIYGD